MALPIVQVINHNNDIAAAAVPQPLSKPTSVHQWKPTDLSDGKKSKQEHPMKPKATDLRKPKQSRPVNGHVMGKPNQPSTTDGQALRKPEHSASTDGQALTKATRPTPIDRDALRKPMLADNPDLSFTPEKNLSEHCMSATVRLPIRSRRPRRTEELRNRTNVETVNGCEEDFPEKENCPLAVPQLHTTALLSRRLHDAQEERFDARSALEELDICEPLHAAICADVTAALNFPRDEQNYKNLVALDSDEPAPAIARKKLLPRPKAIDLKPDLMDFWTDDLVTERATTHNYERHFTKNTNNHQATSSLRERCNLLKDVYDVNHRLWRPK